MASRRSILVVAIATVVVTSLVQHLGGAAVATCASPGSPPLRGVTAIVIDDSASLSCSYTSSGGSLGWVGAATSCTVTAGSQTGNCSAPGALTGVPNGTSVLITINVSGGKANGIVGVGDQNYS